MKTIEFRAALLTLALVPALATGQSGIDDARPISLDEAVRLARQNSPATIQSRGSLRVGGLTVTSALSQFLPSIGVSASAHNSSSASFFQGQFVPYSGPPWSYNKGYFSSLTLFDGGRHWFNYRAAQANQSANVENDVLAQYNVTLSVKQQYYAVLAAREFEAAAERQLEQAEQDLRVSSAKMSAGAAMRSDSLRSAIAVGTARLAIITAQSNLLVANAFLTRLVASPIAVTAVAADTSDVPHIEIDSAELGRLAENGPGVRQAVASLEASRGVRRATLTSYLPSVSANYSFSTNTTSADYNWGGGPASKSSGYGFFLGFTIFDNFGRELNVMTATVNEENADANLRDARLLARQNLATYLAAFRTAAQTIELQRLQVAFAEEDLHALQSRYALGASPLLDLLTSQATLDNQRAALINARLQARTAKAQLEVLVGRELR
jgi:outer membrane protein